MYIKKSNFEANIAPIQNRPSIANVFIWCSVVLHFLEKSFSSNAFCIQVINGNEGAKIGLVF